MKKKSQTIEHHKKYQKKKIKKPPSWTEILTSCPKKSEKIIDSSSAHCGFRFADPPKKYVIPHDLHQHFFPRGI